MFKDVFFNENFVFWLKFNWSTSLRSNSPKLSIGSSDSLVPHWREAITQTIDDQVHLCIYASPGLGVIVLTLKRPVHFSQNTILFSYNVHNKCNTLVWNWPNTMNIQSALWILMAWCFSTRASVVTVLSTHQCISQCLRFNIFSTTPI